MQNISIELWDEDKFKNSAEEWSNLLECSTSDKLFMSWEWLSTWWNVFSNSQTMQLRVIAVSDNHGQLIGLAPLYISVVSIKGLFKSRQLQFLGNCWRDKITMRTELQDFIVDKNYSQSIIINIYTYIREMNGWDELILSDLDKETETYKVLISQKPIPNAYYRYAEVYHSYFLNILKTFDHYCQSLGKNTRLKLLNRRKILETLGVVKFVEYKGSNIQSCFELLNDFHKKRWGKAVFERKQLEFNLEVAKLMGKKGALYFSVITLNNKPVSIQYNYILDKHEYNIQAGFDEHTHKKISMGYLHFGYEFESAFQKGISVYDFLAGEGKNTQYKARLTDTTLNIVSMQIIKNKFISLIYRVYDYYKSH